jgi:outer membrane protein OmpA-like peptidoglycan-associated protein
MNRSYSTISYIFKNQDRATQILLSKILRGSGFSYSKKITINADEDRKKSRRVTFKIILH